MDNEGLATAALLFIVSVFGMFLFSLVAHFIEVFCS
jgi:hypothetical protein